MSILNKLKDFYKWMGQNIHFEENLTFSSIVKIFIATVPIYGILYLTSFYNSFEIRYFLYFYPSDFIKVFYENNHFLLIIFLTFTILIAYCNIMYYKSHKLLFFRLIFTALAAVEILLLILLFKINCFLLLLIGLIILLHYGLIYIKKWNAVFYGYTILIIFFGIFLAKHQAQAIKKNKFNFDIILNDGTYLLEENKNNRCSYFIGNLTNYVFIYDCSICKIRAVHQKNIKEIRFSTENN